MSLAEQVKATHEEALLRIPGVVGVGVTDGELGESVIAVYVTGEDVVAAVPSEIEGVRVRVVVSGEFDALGVH